MQNEDRYFITTSWPYSNGEAHVGHIAGNYLPADIYKRFLALQNKDSVLISGNDMHGTPTKILSEKLDIPPLEIANKYKREWEEVFKMLDIKFDLWTSTSTKNHQKIVQKIFKNMYENKDIYIDKEIQPYCVKEKRFLPDRFVEGECPNCKNKEVRVGESCDKCGIYITFEKIIDPYCIVCKSEPILKETENFFLDLPKFQDRIKKYIDSKKNIFRPNVIDQTYAYMKDGLKPRSITRDIDYGIPVPIKGYENKVIYVWFEALIGYYSASVEYTKEENNKYWTKETKSIYFMAKDNITFHTIMLPAILFANKLPPPTYIVSSEYVTMGNKKLSKSKSSFGVKDLIKIYGKDNVRFYLTSIIPEKKDTNFDIKNLEDAINKTLSSNVGNYINRTLTFIDKYFDSNVEKYESKKEEEYIKEKIEKISSFFNNFEFQAALREIIDLSDYANRLFDSLKIWESKDKKDIYILFQYVYALNIALTPIIPESMEKLSKIINTEINSFSYSPIYGKINSPYILFPKIEKNDY